ncbi:unnamed protein product [Ectocarpus sp. CCAP 1310/34]|nr:unnamed protein product [Ectocarpus sp. CCAP 1310/34]
MLQASNTLLHRVMWRYTKTHMQLTREDLSEGQLVGEDRLQEDFLAQIGTLQSVVCKCTRKARAWGRLSNGWYSSTNAKAFQEGASMTVPNFSVIILSIFAVAWSMAVLTSS